MNISIRNIKKFVRLYTKIIFSFFENAQDTIGELKVHSKT